MFKKAKVLALAASVVACAGAAHAGTIELNLYGASAESTLWNSLGQSFLKAAYGCLDSEITGSTANSASGGIHQCVHNGNTYILRYMPKNSVDGILSVQGQVDSQGGVSDVCSDATKRMMFGTTASTSADTCVKVDVGASDVSGDAFIQHTKGCKLGPNSQFPTQTTCADMTDRSYAGVSTSGLTAYNPVIVPFGFYANKAVQVGKCVGGDNAGALCSADADCQLTSATGTCTYAPIDNLTREQAVLLFSGQVVNWSDLGAAFKVVDDSGTKLASQAVRVCHRHAGSGTLATLDLGVLNNGAWGGALPTIAKPNFYFNDGSGDMMKCVDGWTATNGKATAPAGAVGYADADALVGVTAYPHTVALTYQGVAPLRNNIRNGWYDFFAQQYLYESAATASDADKHAMMVALNNFAANPAKLTTTTSLGKKALYWTTVGEAKFRKSLDSAYPAKTTDTVTPVLP